MIILHCATAEETKQKVYGYALREDGKVFIVREDGVKVPVRAETVMPYQACHRLEDYISLTKRTLVNIIPLGSHQFPASEPPGNFFLESHLRQKI